MRGAPFAFEVFARVNLPKARPAWKVCGQSLPALSARVLLRADLASARGRVRPMLPDPKRGKPNSCLRPQPTGMERETGA